MESVCGHFTSQKGRLSRFSGANTFGLNLRWSGLQNLAQLLVCLQSLELFDFVPSPSDFIVVMLLFRNLNNYFGKYSVIKTDWHHCQNYENKTQVVVNLNYAVHSWELVIAEPCRSCQFGETGGKKMWARSFCSCRHRTKLSVMWLLAGQPTWQR